MVNAPSDTSLTSELNAIVKFVFVVVKNYATVTGPRSRVIATLKAHYLSWALQMLTRATEGEGSQTVTEVWKKYIIKMALITL